MINKTQILFAREIGVCSFRELTHTLGMTFQLIRHSTSMLPLEIPAGLSLLKSREAIAVSCENYTKHINGLVTQNAGHFDVKSDGMHNSRSPLKDPNRYHKHVNKLPQKFFMFRKCVILYAVTIPF
jgi:hypothetical protein